MNKRFLSATAIILAAMNLSLFAQYKGKVIDLHTGAGIPAAKVIMMESGLETTTDIAGNYEFTTSSVRNFQSPTPSFEFQGGALVLKGSKAPFVKIFDNSGKMVTRISGSFRNGQTNFYLPELSYGNYRALVEAESNHFHTSFMVQKDNIYISGQNKHVGKALHKKGLAENNEELGAEISIPVESDTLAFSKDGYVSKKLPVQASKKTNDVKLPQKRFSTMIPISSGTLPGFFDTEIDSFLMDTVEVTVYHYNWVMNATVLSKKSLELLPIDPPITPGTPVFNTKPIEEISYFDAILYCNKRSKLFNLDTCYTYDSIGSHGSLEGLEADHNKFGFRLPTQSEWQYAAKANHTGDYPWDGGVEKADEYAWYSENTTSAQPVGQKKPNGWGLYDMAGNVAEWIYGLHPSGGILNPGNINWHVKALGGSYDGDINQIRYNHATKKSSPELPYSEIGFRVVINYPKPAFIVGYPIEDTPEWEIPQL